MTIPFACVVVAYLLIWIPRTFVVRELLRAPGGYDNDNPREQQARLEGRGKRAVAAHNNTFEAFAPFAAAVVIAHLAKANPTWSSALALSFVGARLLYPILYIANFATARSAVWIIGAGATLGLFLIGWM